MRIVFVTSDWAMTGPADPMLQAAAGLGERGHEVSLVLPGSPDPAEAGVEGAARRRGLVPRLEIERARGVHPWRDRRDARRLRELVEASDAEVVHAWHSRGHGLAWSALRKRRRAGRSVLVRSHRCAERPAAWPWNRWLFGPATDGLWCVSPGSAEANRSLRGGRPIAGALGGIDLDRFRTLRNSATLAEARRQLRIELGVDEQATLVGVVARVQAHRRFDLLLSALRRVAERRPELHLVVLGRGTHLDRVAREPAATLGLAERVHFAGHREGDDYVRALCALDWLTFLVPGSDGGCRAVLEAAACGLPCVATRRGALPEIVLDERTGLLVDEDERGLAAAWERMAADPGAARALGRAASQRALAAFGAAPLAEALEAFYREVVSGAASRRGDRRAGC